MTTQVAATMHAAAACIEEACNAMRVRAGRCLACHAATAAAAATVHAAWRPCLRLIPPPSSALHVLTA
ncbi:hypothetical protein EON66_10385, partial [archaeon]